MMVPLLWALAMKDTRKSESDQSESLFVPINLWKYMKKFDNCSSGDYRAQLQFQLSNCKGNLSMSFTVSIPEHWRDISYSQMSLYQLIKFLSKENIAFINCNLQFQNYTCHI